MHCDMPKIQGGVAIVEYNNTSLPILPNSMPIINAPPSIYSEIILICKIQKRSMTYRHSETYSNKIPQKLTTTACFIKGNLQMVDNFESM